MGGVCLSLLCPGVGFYYLVGVQVFLYVGSSLWFDPGVPCLWAWFIWLVCLLAYVGFLYRADVPFPMFIGEVLSVFRFLWEPWFLVFLVVCGALPFWK